MHRADNLTTFMCRLSWNLEATTSWNPHGLSRPVMGWLYLWSTFLPPSLWYSCWAQPDWWCCSNHLHKSCIGLNISISEAKGVLILVLCWCAFSSAYPGTEVPGKMMIYGLVKRFQDIGCVQYRKYVQHLTVLTEEKRPSTILKKQKNDRCTNVAFCMWTLSDAGHTSCHRNFLCPNRMLPGYTSIPHLVPCHLEIAMFFMSESTKFRC